MKKNIIFTMHGFIAYNLLWLAAVACFNAYGKGMEELYDKTFGKFVTADILLYRLKGEGKITDAEWKMYQDNLKSLSGKR
jgi:hypothetical protein